MTILGCGTTAIDPHKGCPGFLMQSGGKNLLLESGSGTLYRLVKTGIRLDEIGTLCYSHHHPDHVSDLLPLLHSLKWDPGLQKYPREMNILGPPKVLDLYHQLMLFYQDSLSPDGNRLNVHLLSTLERQVSANNLIIDCITVDHTPDSTGYRFSIQDKTFAYSGDAGLDANLIKLAEGCDLLLCECSFPNRRKMRGHMCPRDVGALIREANPKKVLLTHIYPQWNSEEKKELDKILESDRVSLAKDCMSLSI